MWTRTYLFLLALRLYFALSPSYIHPDENFQGPEVIAGRTFDFSHHLSWEFTAAHPIRSVFPLWPVYGLPMTVLQWMWAGTRDGDIAPALVYYTLRLLMWILSFVLEDWALHELIESPRHRRLAITLVASSYVTWTYQTHTFSNAIETLVVLWTLVMIQRLRNVNRDSLLSPTILGILLTFGVFNRITFPAFILIPGLFLLPILAKRPLSILCLVSAVLTTTSMAIIQDTYFYRPDTSLRDLVRLPVITPLNSLLYNSQTANLEAHGLHPPYQHLLANLPLLLGPIFLLIRSINLSPVPLTAISAVSGVLILSAIPHQEARFLLPTVPLVISSVHLPRSRTLTRYWLALWILFNTIFGILMGVFHQGGVVPMQMWLSNNHHLFLAPAASAAFTSATANSNSSINTTTVKYRPPPSQPLEDVVHIFWWRTYPPPIWLLDHTPINTTNLMGIPFPTLQTHILDALNPPTSSPQDLCNPDRTIGLVAPLSSLDLEAWRAPSPPPTRSGNHSSSSSSGQGNHLIWHDQHRCARHVNLDDLDFGTADRGVTGELARVLGKTGLGVWSIRRDCSSSGGDEGGGHGGGGLLVGDW